MLATMTHAGDARSHARAGTCGAQRHVRAMTVIELMATMIVLGVLISLVVAPAMSGMVARHRVQGIQSELLGDLQLARSEQAQRSGVSTAVPVSVSFGGNADITCYTIHTAAAGLPCDCTLPPGTTCSGVAGAQELKTMQFARTDGVTVVASSASGPRITFSPPQGAVMPDNLVIDVQAASGQLRTSISGLGVPSVCSPDGSIPGVRTPCP
jgi:type IV fimbrial biogenesis protein FimT